MEVNQSVNGLETESPFHFRNKWYISIDDNSLVYNKLPYENHFLSTSRIDRYRDPGAALTGKDMGK